MKFVGYAQMRRGIVEHLVKKKLSMQEFAVLSLLILLADHQTGVGEMNAAVLRTTWIPGLSEDASKRVLLSLERKKYIFRGIRPRSVVMYPYAIDKYIPSVGPNAGLLLSTAKAHVTKDFRDIQYIKPAPEGAPVDAPEGARVDAPEGAHYNKKEELKTDKEKENSSTGIGECVSSALSVNTGCKSDSAQSDMRSAHQARINDASVPHRSASPLKALSESLKPTPTPTSDPTPAPASPKPAPPIPAPATDPNWVSGMWHDNSIDRHRDAATNAILTRAEVAERREQLIEFRAGKIYQRSTGRVIDMAEAAKIINSGGPKAA